jgi:hypothetical protein
MSVLRIVGRFCAVAGLLGVAITLGGCPGPKPSGGGAQLPDRFQPHVFAGKWQRIMDAPATTKVSVSLPATSVSTETIGVNLMVGCVEGRQVLAAVNWMVPVQGGDNDIRWSVDDAQPIPDKWVATEDGRQMMVDLSVSHQWVDTISRSRKLVLTATEPDGTPIEATFDLDGVDQVAREVDAACPLMS